MDLKEFMVSMAFAVQKKLASEVEVVPQTVKKNNGVIWQGLSFRKAGCKSAPTIYLEPFYEAFQEGVALEILALQMAEYYDNYAKEIQPEAGFFSKYEEVRPKVAYKLIHYQSNEKLLAEVPHVPYLDLAVVFYCLVSSSEIGLASILIRNSHLKNWNITLARLYEDAKNNTPKLLKPEFRSMEEILQLPAEELQDAPMLYVLTNQEQMNGAASILYEGVLDACAERFQTSFFVMPSSIHEMILLPYERHVEIGSLKSIVREANQTQVEPQDRLSDSVYFYSRDEKKLLIL